MRRLSWITLSLLPGTCRHQSRHSDSLAHLVPCDGHLEHGDADELREQEELDVEQPALEVQARGEHGGRRRPRAAWDGWRSHRNSSFSATA